MRWTFDVAETSRGSLEVWLSGRERAVAGCVSGYNNGRQKYELHLLQATVEPVEVDLISGKIQSVRQARQFASKPTSPCKRLTHYGILTADTREMFVYANPVHPKAETTGSLSTFFRGPS